MLTHSQLLLSGLLTFFLFLTHHPIFSILRKVGENFLGTVKQVVEQYYRRLIDLENRKYDLEKEVELRDFQVDWQQRIHIVHSRKRANQ